MEHCPILPRVADAASGSQGYEALAIADTGLRWIDLILRKNHDYGGSAWKAPALAPNCDPGTAILVRMSDKIARLEKLLGSDASPQVSESIDDTIRDLGAYCLLYLARPKTENSPETDENEDDID